MNLHRRGTIVSLLILCVFLGVNLDPNVRMKMSQAFGDRPLGVPVILIVGIAEVLLLLPLFRVPYHMLLILQQGQRDGLRIHGELGLMLYLLRVSRVHPELQRSQAIVAFGGLYMLGIFAVWIVYATVKGI